MAKENRENTAAEIHGRRARQELITLELEKIASLAPDVRQEKILALRQQLVEDKYDINNRLNVALEKILENLARNKGGKASKKPKVVT